MGRAMDEADERFADFIDEVREMAEERGIQCAVLCLNEVDPTDCSAIVGGTERGEAFLRSIMSQIYKGNGGDE